MLNAYILKSGIRPNGARITTDRWRLSSLIEPGDCLTDTHAIEFDFGNKWAEAIGQALYYFIQTGKRAGVVLILKKQKDYKYWIRLNTIVEHYGLPIDVWKVRP